MEVNFFTDEKGCLSMRRLLAFIFALATIGAIVGNILCQTEWKISLITIAIPAASSLLMMFFTSWSDIANVAAAVKK